MDRSASEVLRLAADRTLRYDFTVWFWGDAIAVDGLLEAGELGDHGPARDHATRFLTQWSMRPLEWVDHLTPGAALLRLALAGETEQSFFEAARRLATWLVEDVPTTGGAPLYRPDLPAYRHAVWVDSLYHVPTFLASLGMLSEEPALVDAAVDCWSAHVVALCPNQEGFYAHTFDAGAQIHHGYGWGRGQGWALLGTIDLLSLMPKDWPAYERLANEARRVGELLLGVQDSTGHWRTLLHDRTSYLEVSTAAFFGASFVAGRRLGVLDDRYAEAADRAWHAVLPYLGDDGSLWGVSACTHAGVSALNDDVNYKTLPTETNVWGQGSIMRFAAERLRSGLP